MDLVPEECDGSRLNKIGLHKLKCTTCNNTLRKPTTCKCGLTRCQECILSSPCWCGNTIPMCINKIIENINNKITVSKESPDDNTKPLIRKNISGKVIKKRKRKSRRINTNIDNTNLFNHLVWKNLSDILEPADIECAICKDILVCPVTTPCGHVFCKLCIERQIFYRASCPLCNSTDLLLWDGFKPTLYLVEILKLMGHQDTSDKGFFIPILKIAAGYPGVTCSVLFKTSLEFLMNLFQPSKNTFGIIAPDQEHNYGTVVEVKQILPLAVGCIQVTAVGISRFRLLEKYKMDGYTLAHVVTIHDEPLIDQALVERFAKTLLIRANLWLRSLENNVRPNVINYIGTPSLHEVNISTSFNENGPTWLWRLINILPLGDEAVVHLIREPCVLTRIIVVCQIINRLLPR